MRGIAKVSAFLFVMGCAQQQVVAVKAPEATRPDCYTVDLFDSFSIQEPAPDVPAEYARFLGDWGDGAWQNEWCHDLLITKVHRDGKVELVDLHAPYAAVGAPATAFKRTGRIDEDGNLRFAYGTETRVYRFVGDKLVGKRSGRYGNMEIVLANRAGPDVRIAKAKN